MDSIGFELAEMDERLEVSQNSNDYLLHPTSTRCLKLMRKKRNSSPRDKLVAQLKDLVGQDVWCEELENQVPRKWEKHGDLLLLPENSFKNEQWETLGDKLWTAVSNCLIAERVAMKRVIMADDYRTPQVTLLKGSIGYFTLPYLVHAKADIVYACEWNPQAVSALKHNLCLNKVQMQCHVYEGDCRKVCPSNVADRVNLGLIPSSALAWEVACKALKNKSGGILHVHGNVDLVKPSGGGNKNHLWWKWADEVRIEIAQLSASLGRNWSVSVDDVHRIKSYAANVDHLVVDIICKPE
uniref:tRNA(Phe) (4-demethylwyosine(37)-C(7)) aminocarboxypropyltransferase n=1 Tax=Strigamia maritima TaxID=126957 RepID=T1JHK5_STRMM